MIVNYGSEKEEFFARDIAKIFNAEITTNIDYNGVYPDDMVFIGVYNDNLADRTNNNINHLVANEGFNVLPMGGGGVLARGNVGGKVIFVLSGDTHGAVASAVLEVIRLGNFPAEVQNETLQGLKYVEFAHGISANLIHHLTNGLHGIINNVNNTLRNLGINSVIEMITIKGDVLGVYVSGTTFDDILMILVILFGFIVAYYLSIGVGLIIIGSYLIYKLTDYFDTRSENQAKNAEIAGDFANTKASIAQRYIDNCANGTLPLELCTQDMITKVLDYASKINLDTGFVTGEQKEEESIFDKAGKFLLTAGIGVLGFIVVRDYVLPSLEKRKQEKSKKTVVIKHKKSK